MNKVEYSFKKICISSSHQTHAPRNRKKGAVSGEGTESLFIKPNRKSLFTTKKLLVKNGREAKGCREIDLFLIRLPLKDSYMECSFGENLDLPIVNKVFMF